MEALGDEVVVGVDLGGTKIFAGLVDAAGRVAGETYVAHGAGSDGAAGETAYERLVGVIRELAAAAGAQGRRVRGAGVGAPGVTRADGTVISAPALGWRELPLAARLQVDLGLPVRVDNDVNAIGLGEHRFGAGQGTRSLFVMAVGTGIGGAVIVDGRLHRGRHDAAGEVGALLPGLEFLSWQNRDWGALESVASGSGIAARARKLADAHGIPVPREGFRAEDVFLAAADGAPWARAVFDETIEYLALAVANVQALLDPDRIVLAGGVGRAADRVIPAIERRLAGVLPFPPDLVASALGYRAGVLGAAALVS